MDQAGSRSHSSSCPRMTLTHCEHVQASLTGGPSDFTDEMLSPDLDDLDDYESVYRNTEGYAGQSTQSPSEDPSSGAPLRNPSRLEILGLASRNPAGSAEDESETLGGEEWLGADRPTVADLDAMGWFDDDDDGDGDEDARFASGPPGNACLHSEMAPQGCEQYTDAIALQTTASIVCVGHKGENSTEW